MKPLYIKKNGVINKVGGIAMPPTYPSEDVTYDNTSSGLTGDTVQEAIDELAQGQSGGVQSDWNEADDTQLDYIKNKPTLGTASSKDVPTSGDAGNTEVVLGSDSRLSDARTPTSHTHTTSDISDFPTMSDYIEKSNTAGLVKNDGTIDTNTYAQTSSLGTAAAKNVPTSGDASTTEVVMGNDSRLTDARTPVSHTHTTSQITDFPTMTDYIQKSNTSGLVKNDGSIDTNTYATTTDISGKADKSEMSVTDGTGSDADKTTIQLKSGTSATVLKTHQDISGKVDKVDGKGLSTNDYTTDEKTKLSGIETGAQVNTITGIKGNAESSYRTGNVNITPTNIGLGNVDNTSDSTKKTNFTGSIASGNTGFTTGGDVYTALGGKADKVSSATNGNLAGLNGTGNLTDSGWNGAKDTTSISGNPISISGLKANQLAVNPIITLEPIQAGSGTPSPSNIRAISGYDKIEVLSCGKNLCDNSNNKTGGYYNASGSWVVDSSHASSGLIPVAPNTTYRGCMYNKSTKQPINDMVYVLWSDETTGTGQYTSATITTGADTKYITIRNYSADASYITKNNFLFALELGDTSSATYPEHHKATSISESLGQTVYGGTLDVRTGKLTVTHGVVDLGTLTWQNDQTTRPADGVTIHAHFASFTDCKVIASSVIANMYCSIYAPSTVNKVDYGGGNEVMDAIIGGADNNRRIWIYDSRYNDTSAADFKTAMSGIMLVYELATPFIIQLTPHEISLLKDYAYVSTNATSMSFRYHNGEMASLSDVSQLGETVNLVSSRFQAPDYPKAVFAYNSNLAVSDAKTYTCPQNGYIMVQEAYGEVVSATDCPYFQIKVGNVTVFRTQAFTATNNRCSGVCLPVSKGDVITFLTVTRKLNQLTVLFIPCKLQ